MRRLLVVLIMSCLLVGCQSAVAYQPQSLLKNIRANTVNEVQLPSSFTDYQVDFAFDVFKNVYSTDANTLVSPLSMQFAFSMLTNGAVNTTLSEMEQVITGNTAISEYNVLMYSLMKDVLGKELLSANSVWFRDGFEVSSDFLQTVKDHYVAEAFQEAFDHTTVDAMNAWVKENTKDMIDQLVEKIDDSVMMYLVNALAFEATWEKQYTTNDVNKVPFIDYLGNEQMVDMMFSKENKYIELDDVVGFVKDYEGAAYSFVALLPQGDITEFVQSLDSEKYVEIMSSVKEEKISAGLPKFTFSQTVGLKDLFKSMGMQSAFDVNSANFSKIAENLYISDALQKTYICVNETGTTAAAVTSIEMGLTSTMMDSVFLDRPFVYMIVNNTTNIPVFVGSVMSFEE